MFASHFQQQTILSHTKDCFNVILDFETTATVIVILGIPLYELAIYPLARNWIPSTLKRVGIGAFGTIIVASVALTVRGRACTHYCSSGVYVCGEQNI